LALALFQAEKSLSVDEGGPDSFGFYEIGAPNNPFSDADDII
jgi:hypothetical protein